MSSLHGPHPECESCKLEEYLHQFEQKRPYRVLGTRGELVHDSSMGPGWGGGGREPHNRCFDARKAFPGSKIVLRP